MDHNEPIPALRPPDQLSPIRSQDDLHQHWRALMGPLGFSKRTLWITFLDSDAMMTPLITQVEDAPRFPDRRMLDSLMCMVEGVLEQEVTAGSLALLLSRPGPEAFTESDLAWAQGLFEAAGRNSVPLEPLHLATDEDLRVFAPDDLVRPSST